jgi:hypothetical protein
MHLSPPFLPKELDLARSQSGLFFAFRKQKMGSGLIIREIFPE